MFWDHVAWAYDFFVHVINRNVHQKLRSEVAALFSSSDEVLECACGTGMLTVCIAPKCMRVVATDLSRNMLKKTRKKCASFRNVVCEPADIMNLHYDDNSFDVVLAANVIHLLSEPERALSEMCRVCRDGGRLIIPTYVAMPECEMKDAEIPSAEKIHTKKRNLFSKIVENMGAGFQRQFTPEEYREFFRTMGYEDVDYFVVEGRLPCAVATVHNHK